MGAKLNVRRGMNRLGAVLSGIYWIIAGIVIVYNAQDATRTYNPFTQAVEVKQNWFVAAIMSASNGVFWAGLVFFVLMCAWRAVGWIISGFKPSTQQP